MSENNTNLIFSRVEENIKVYRYYTSTLKDHDEADTNRNLIVTTKRIILESVNKHGFSRDEFPVEYIERIDTRFFRSKKSAFGLIMLLLGLIIAASALIIGPSLDVVFTGFHYLVAGLGVVILVLGIVHMAIKKSKRAFKLTLYSSKEFFAFSTISAENYVLKERNTKKESKKVKVVSNVTPAAFVMLNELNALLIDIKDFNAQIEYAKQMVLRKNLSPEEYEHHYHYLLNKIVTLYK